MKTSLHAVENSKPESYCGDKNSHCKVSFRYHFHSLISYRMAINPKESYSLLPQDEKKCSEYTGSKTDVNSPEALPQEKAAAYESDIGNGHGWTADGLPLGHGSVVGEPMGRTPWKSCICCCLGQCDDFCSSDLEVCVLGSVAPCVLYGSNVERLESAPGTFGNHCLAYCVLLLIGYATCHRNWLAPCFLYPNRTAIRRKFNLEGSCDALNEFFGCCESCLKDDMQRERCESACDLATHIFCHPCALCQEGRELRRRLPHQAFNAQPSMVMIPPAEQIMGRGA